jgi:hypothetical protein
MHARDARVVVQARPRCVLVDGRPLFHAATTLIKAFGDEFDAAATVKRMRTVGPWPSLGYAVRSREVVEIDSAWSTQVVQGDRVLHVIAPGEVVDAATARALFGEDVRLLHYERAMTEREVLAQWDAKARAARDQGIEAHRRIEEHLLGKSPPVAPTPHATPETVAQAFLDAHIAPLGGRVVATEWCIFDEAASVVATVDAVVRFPSGALGLIDWKHTSGLATRMTSSRRLKPPFTHLPDCDVVRYCIQLAIYARIIERNYGMRVCSLVLVNTRSDDAFFTDLPYLEEEAELLLEQCAARVRCRPDAEPRCVSDGRLAIDPVRCEDGAIRSRRVAQASGFRYGACELAASAAATLQHAINPSPREKAMRATLDRRSVDWEVLMPPQGVPRVQINFANFHDRYFS